MGKKKKLIVLANDPSFTAWGYSVIRLPGDKILDTGVIKTEPSGKKSRIRKSDDRMRRTQLIVRQLHDLVKNYDVTYVVSESPHGSQNASAAIMIGIVQGVLQTLCDVKGLSIEWYSEADSKQYAGLAKGASKLQMIEKMEDIFPKQKWKTGIKYRDEAIADSLGVFNCAKQLSSVFKVF